METSLLATKFFIPPLQPGLIARPHLMEQLNGVLNHRITLVSAPAGFGKTTAVIEWVNQNKSHIPLVWLSLDDDDNDPVRFWDYFITAVRQLVSNCGENALAILHSTQEHAIESILCSFINDLISISVEMVIILDDYHLIKTGQIHAGIIYLIEHLPTTIHLVIISRSDPPLPIARFRGKGMMLEINTNDLRFTVDDTAKLFKELRIIEITVTDIATLNERIEGWVVGLKMAAFSMRGQSDIPGFIAAFTGSQRFIMDYLMEEVLQVLKIEIRDFLIKTSILERLNGSLCDALTGQKDGHDMLRNIDREHLFIMPLDESRKWYRYEHLFADLLKHQLEKCYGFEQVINLHRQASGWYQNNNMIDEAISHALAAKDWDKAIYLISGICETQLERQEWKTLYDWLELIPKEELQITPRLYRAYADCLVYLNEFEKAHGILDSLEKTVYDNDLLGEIALSKMIIATGRGNYRLTEQLGTKALKLLHIDNFSKRAEVSSFLGAINVTKYQLDKGYSLYTEANNIWRQIGNNQRAASSTNQLGFISSLRGRLREAVNMYRQSIELAGNSPFSGFPKLNLGAIYYEWNDLEQSLNNVNESIHISKMNGETRRIGTYYYKARILLLKNDISGAEAEIAQGDYIVNPKLWRPPQAYHIANRILFAITRDDIDTARKWGTRLTQYFKENPEINYVQDVIARLMIACGNRNMATGLLKTLYNQAIQVGARGYAITIRVYQALATETSVDAVAYLSEALKWAKPEGYIRTFVDEGKLLLPLLREALSRGITPEYTTKLINIIEDESHRRRTLRVKSGIYISNPALLSDREMEVLRLIATGLPNKKITQKLMITQNTLKTHIRHIFEKLDTKDRIQAITRARELKLI
jgi:LuxR family transcriptional regulator, maltose regulon positive regulatory protein